MGDCALQQLEAPSLPLAAIRVDWAINARATVRREVSLDYAEALKAGAKFPPVIIFFDGETYWLADGFHRYVAYEIAGIPDIPVEIRLGTPRDGQSPSRRAADPVRPAAGDRPHAGGPGMGPVERPADRVAVRRPARHGPRPQTRTGSLHRQPPGQQGASQRAGFRDAALVAPGRQRRRSAASTSAAVATAPKTPSSTVTMWMAASCA